MARWRGPMRHPRATPWVWSTACEPPGPDILGKAEQTMTQSPAASDRILADTARWAGITLLLAALLAPGFLDAQIVGPPFRPPEVESEIELDDDILGIVLAGAVGWSWFSGVAAHALDATGVGQAYIGLDFGDVVEGRVGASWARPYDRIAETNASIGSVYLELLWTAFDGGVVLRGGPRFAWYRMDRTLWDNEGGARSTVGGGGVVSVLWPVGDRIELETSFTLSAFTTTRPGVERFKAVQPVLEPLVRFGLRYRIR